MGPRERERERAKKTVKGGKRDRYEMKEQTIQDIWAVASVSY